MRNLALFLLVVLALLLVLKFFPTEEAQGAGGAEGTGTPFLERPTNAQAGGSLATDSLTEPDEAYLQAQGAESPETTAQTAVVPAEVQGEFAGSNPARGGSDQEMVDWDPRREVNLAGAVLHGTRRELESEIAALGTALPAGRADLARSFQRAIAGDPEQARQLAQTVNAGASTDEEQRLLRLALGVGGSGPAPASFSTRSGGPLARAMAIGLREQEAANALEAGDYGLASRHYSEVIKAALDSPWRVARADLKRWSSALHQGQERHRWRPDGEWPAEELEVQRGDSLVRIRLRYLKDKADVLMCTGLIAKANGLRNSTIHPGDPLRLPTARVSALVDLSSRWMLYMHDDEVVYSWEVAIGRQGEETITGDFTIGEKLPEPPWTRVGKPIVPYGDPENPLGTHWLTWLQGDRKTSYGFHGTWEPETLGTQASDGCIRLHNDNIALLFDIMPKGAGFTVRE